MIKLVIFISFAFLSLQGIAQKVNYNYYAYVRAGFKNEIGFSTDFAYDSIQFEMNRVICRTDSNSLFIYPKKAGKDTIHSIAYFKGKVVHSDKFILDVMKPEVFGVFKPHLQTKLKLDFIKRFPGVSFNIRINNYHWEPISIVSYRFSIIRDHKVIYSVTGFSNRFSDQLKAEIEQLKAGDLILISEIVTGDFYKEIADPMPTIYEVES